MNALKWTKIHENTLHLPCTYTVLAGYMYVQWTRLSSLCVLLRQGFVSH